jgi:hypothetical protein
LDWCFAPGSNPIDHPQGFPLQTLTVMIFDMAVMIFLLNFF